MATPPDQLMAVIASSIKKFPDPVLGINNDGQFVYANDYAFLYLGYSSDELMEMYIWDIEPTYSKEQFTLDWKHQKKSPTSIASQHRTKDGHEIPVSVMPIYEKCGDIEICICHVKIISLSENQTVAACQTALESTQAHGKLLEKPEVQKNLLRGVIDELPIPLTVKNYEGKFVLVNKALALLYGVADPSEMIGKDDGDYIPDPKQAEFFRQNVRQIMDEGKTHTVYEDSYDAPTGEKRHYMSIKKPFLTHEGKKHILVIANDVTDIRKAEQSLLQYKKIMSVSYDFLSFQNKQGIYQAVNEAYLKAFNISREQIIGKSNREILGEEHYDTYIKPKFEKALSGDVDSYETWVDFPALGNRFVEVNYYPYRPESDGDIEGVVVKVNDITDRKLIAEALDEQKQLLRGVIDELPNPLIVKDYDGKFVLTNKAVATLYGVDNPTDMVGKDDGDYIPDPNQAEFFRQNVRQIMDEGKTQTVYEDSFDANTGERRNYMSTKKPFLNPKGEKEILVIANDITEIRKAQKTLVQYEKIMSLSRDFLAYLDKDGVYQAINDAYVNAFQLTREEIIGKSAEQLLGKEFYQTHVEQHLKKALSGEVTTYSVWLTFPALGKRFVEVSFHPYWEEDSSEIEGLVLKVDDITDHFETQEKLRYIADHDALTGLANRRMFSNRLSQALKRATRQNQQLAVLFLDLDRFKAINDSLGHSMGDKVLQEIAGRMHDRIRDTDTLARSGGDEFLLLLENIHHHQDVVNICESLLTILSEPIVIGNNELFVTGSIGVSLYPDDATDQEQLIQSADTAMYQAKKLGRNAYQFSSAEMRGHVSDKALLEKNLHLAIERQEFCLFYQAQINMQTQQMVGAEALLRWLHPSMGMISPTKFIPIAEECGIILPLGKWVLENACKQMKTWLDTGYRINSLSVNVSGNQLLQSNFAEMVQACLLNSGLSSNFLELEITENYLMDDTDSVANQLKSLRELGVRIAIDDFGTSYSSLRYLQQLPISKLKIDRSFVQDIPDNKGNSAIVKTVIDLAQNMGLTVIAEGVETKAQADFLQNEGCLFAQGFLYAKPTDAEAFQKTYFGGKPIKAN